MVTRDRAWTLGVAVMSVTTIITTAINIGISHDPRVLLTFSSDMLTFSNDSFT